MPTHYRNALPQLDGALFVTDGGIETTLIFHEGLELRIRGLRANASRKSHAELNDSTELDAGNPHELGAQYAEFKRRLLPRLNVVGGCCGTDHRHVEHIASACSPLFS